MIKREGLIEEGSMAFKESIRTVKIIEQGPWSFFFFLAYIGAAIYFVTVSDGSFWGVILGLLQAMVWPVYLIYHTMMLIGA